MRAQGAQGWRVHRLRYACHVAQVYLDTPCSLRGTTATRGTCSTAVLQHLCVKAYLLVACGQMLGAGHPFASGRTP